MKTMRGIVAAAAIAICSSPLAYGQDIMLPEEPLKYEARYHCGFIKIDAGEVMLTFALDGDRLTATMNGCSVPIGGHCYAVSDTLEATMTAIDSGDELSREKVTYENAWYAKPRETTMNGFVNQAKCRSIRGEGELDASSGTMEAVTISADMLAMFYYFQQIDYGSLREGDRLRIAVELPDGDLQQVALRYDGVGTYDGRPTYKMSFRYSYHGEMSDYPVTAYVDQASRLPLLLSADIKIGRIELLLKA